MITKKKKMNIKIHLNDIDKRNYKVNVKENYEDDDDKILEKKADDDIL